LCSLKSGTPVSFVSSPASDLYIQPEAALRLPGVIFWRFHGKSYLPGRRRLFGPEVAFIAAALWAFDPNAIGFNRIAKKTRFCSSFSPGECLLGFVANGSLKADPSKSPAVTIGPLGPHTAR